jgi:hypothetical protein
LKYVQNASPIRNVGRERENAVVPLEDYSRTAERPGPDLLYEVIVGQAEVDNDAGTIRAQTEGIATGAALFD